jgi:hypothetical protein
VSDQIKRETQVVMPQRVAARWVRRIARVEYRCRIMYGSIEYKNLPSLLRSFRDGKVAIKGLAPIPDLGVKEEFDALEVWSSDHGAMEKLGKWAEERGFETSGVW